MNGGERQKMMRSNAYRVPQPGESGAVLGLGISNRELILYLHRSGVRLSLYDQKGPEELGQRWEAVRDRVDRASLGPDYLAAFDLDRRRKGFDWVFVTPGMPRDLPQIEGARSDGSEISSELALFMIACPAPMVGVTGSSGKTTTVSLVDRFLRCDGRQVWLGGNIGTPLIDRLDEIRGDHVVVLEISSFQLETAVRVPQVGAVLNISPDHLDIHRTMANYVDAKARMIRCQQPGDFMVLGADCDRTRELAPAVRGDLAWFSAQQTPDDVGAQASMVAWYADDHLWVREQARDLSLCRGRDLPLRGKHNVKNTLAAALLTLRMGASVDSIREGIEGFAPVRHRLEEVGEIGGVLFVNDSIATSPDRTFAALHSYDRPMVLILGGYNKRLTFDALSGELVRLVRAGRVRALILMGAAAEEIAGSLRAEASSDEGWEEMDALHCVDDLAAAFALARKVSRAGDVVLMSPACASFDAFDNYMQRGDAFRAMVERACRDEGA